MARLIHLAAYPNSHAGSFVPSLAAILDAAGSRGWETIAVLPPEAATRSWIGVLEATGAELIFIEPGRRGPARALRQHLAGREGPTVLHTHWTRYDLAAAASGRGRADVHVYWHVHTVLSGGPRAQLANRLKLKALGNAVDAIFTPAADVAAELVRRGAPASKVTILPNAIDSSRFALATPGSREAARERLELPREAEVLLHFGRDWELKGGDLFLDAVARLAAAGRPAYALVNQGGEAAEVAASARGLESRLRTVGLIEDPRELYHAADALVSSSVGENMPYAVTEALCVGTPVVAGELVGHREVAERVENCEIVRRDPESIAAAVESFLDRDAEGAHHAAEEAHRWVAENLDIRAAAERLVDRYEADLRRVGSLAA
jgi:glycosyltransferase involved in cell wall biosynthesis